MDVNSRLSRIDRKDLGRGFAARAMFVHLI